MSFTPLRGFFTVRGPSTQIALVQVRHARHGQSGSPTTASQRASIMQYAFVHRCETEEWGGGMCRRTCPNILEGDVIENVPCSPRYFASYFYFCSWKWLYFSCRSWRVHDIDLRSIYTAYRYASLIDLCLCQISLKIWNRINFCGRTDVRTDRGRTDIWDRLY